MPKYWGKQNSAHGRFPEVGQKHIINIMLLPTFGLPSFAFDPLRGNSHVRNVPRYFGITRRYVEKTKYFLGIFYFFTRKKEFLSLLL